VKENFHGVESELSLLTVIIPIHDGKERWFNLERIVESREPGVQFVVAYDGLDQNKFSRPQFLLPKDDFIHGNFEGPGQARNNSLLFAKSEWTMFCDSDDRPNFGKAIQAINQSPNTDLIVCQFSDLSNSRWHEGRVASNGDLDWKSFAESPGIWRCIFRSQEIKDQKFPNLRCGEDIVFVSEFLLQKPRKVSFVELLVYEYNSGYADSLSKSERCLQESMKAAKLIISFAKERKFISTNQRLLPTFFATKISIQVFPHNKLEATSILLDILRYTTFDLKIKLISLLLSKLTHRRGALKLL
jgi:glycosyltransferase involved in cell wall biosynthesis